MDFFYDCVKKFEQKKTLIDRIFRRSSEYNAICQCTYFTLKKYNLGNLHGREGTYFFRPVLGMYEFFSALLSLLSFFIVVFHIITNKKRSGLLRVYLFMLLLVFFSSIILHAHRNNITCITDYAFALIAFHIKFYILLSRIAKRKSIKIFFYALSVFLFLTLYHTIAHAFRKYYLRVLGGFYIFLILISYVSLRNIEPSKTLRGKINFVLFLIISAGSIEFFGFAPFFYLIDSHVIWHLFGLIYAHCHINLLKNYFK